ncbi:MAG TPA: 30S ribosomal protein S15, partial [Gammaproteobacteria bacterium]|nr:30S ribosomal protein S15 [Gammaproteobacteria bacterium]HAO97336.1 30S ribosomal protein S15 [Gammaproteobacteria bacterium]
MSIDTQSIIKEYQQEANDTGSTNVQVALLTARIKHLT